jgi:tetratricopeptide (TPR) repeat protein
MAEATEDAGPSIDTGGLAADLAMEEARNDPSLRGHVAAFLNDQRALIADQRHHLHLGVWEKRISVMLRLATLCVGLTFVAALGWMVREAAHADGLKVEPFSVPPAIAERGLTGEVVAAQVIDRLSELQANTNTGRPARTYSNAWGDKAIKLELPETGVSLEELDSWLRAKVGHETPLSGEVVRTATGVTLTARTGKDGAVSVSGAEADMDALTVKLAEAIYRLTQPYRYAIYLMRHENRAADAAPIFRQLALTGNTEERQWSYNMWANATALATGDADLGLRMYQEAHAADPDAGQPYPPLTGILSNFGRVEEAVRLWKEYLAKRAEPNPQSRAAFDRLTGNYHDALAGDAERVRRGVPGTPQSLLLASLIVDQLGMHDRPGARASLADFHPDVGLAAIEGARVGLLIAVEDENWGEALAHQDDMQAYLKERPHDRHAAFTRFSPFLALAHAHSGDFPAAERLIAPTPADCYPCLIARAQIAELASQHVRADTWFARAIEAGPSLPFAFEAHARALLARGKPDAAISQFAIANQKSPHFADPLEGWGEALMAKNQSHLALEKFTEAEKYAPNWGRLHLKWGEALTYAGMKDEARAHFALTAALDLTPSEKSELARQGSKS